MAGIAVLCVALLLLPIEIYGSRSPDGFARQLGSRQSQVNRDTVAGDFEEYRPTPVRRRARDYPPGERHPYTRRPPEEREPLVAGIRTDPGLLQRPRHIFNRTAWQEKRGYQRYRAGEFSVIGTPFDPEATRIRVRRFWARQNVTVTYVNKDEAISP